MIRFPITELMDKKECYNNLLNILHKEGFGCPNGHPLPPEQAPHDNKRMPLVDYKCRICGCVYNIFTNTMWSGTTYDCVTVLLILRGFSQGITTQQLAEELDRDYGTLLKRRHEIMNQALENRPDEPLPDIHTESDEMFQNAGQKGEKHLEQQDPPRCRANKRKGRGTLENDRPPILGVVGRDSGQIRITVCDSVKQSIIQPNVEHVTQSNANIYTDECHAYEHLNETGRFHSSVNHSQKEWARDDDGDGIREVHCNTLEGIWTGLRNYLRPFRGVHKKYLAIYVVMFEWSHNLKRVNDNFLRALMIPNFTYSPI